MARIVGLDVGDKRIGIAVSDPMRTIATPHSVYTRVGYAPDVRSISKLAAEVQADTLVLGLPLNMDGSHGFQADKVEALAEKLQEAGWHTILWDERLTTSSAERSLIQGGMRRDKRKITIDMVAAAIILQSYLDSQK